MQRQRCFEAKRVAGSESGGRDACAEQLLPQRRSSVGGNGNLYAVFSGVTSASHNAAHALPHNSGHAEPFHRCGIRKHCRQSGTSLGTLHRNHGAGLRGFDTTDCITHTVGIRSVGHHIEGLIIDPPHDDVVEHRCIGFVEQVCVLRFARCDFAEVVREGPLQLVERIWARHTNCSEMRNVEHDSATSARQVFFDGSAGIRQRHVPSAEGHHLCAERAMRRIERRIPELGHRGQIATCASGTA